MGIFNWLKKKEKKKVDNSIHIAQTVSRISDLTTALSATDSEERRKEIQHRIEGLKQILIELRENDIGSSEEPASRGTKEAGKVLEEESEEEKKLTETWSKKINNARVYHGTTQNLLDSIQNSGLTTEFSLYDPEDVTKLRQIYLTSPTLSWKIEGSYIMGNQKNGKNSARKAVFLTGFKKEAIVYAKNTAEKGPEYIRHLIKEMILIYESIEAGETPANQETKEWLIRKIGEYERRYTNQKPVLISLDIKTPAILNSFDKEIQELIIDPVKFKEETKQAIAAGVAKDFDDYCSKFKKATFGEFRVYDRIPPEQMHIEEL